MMEFILTGFSDIPNFQWIFWGDSLVLYLTILMCNSVIVLITRIDPTLQTPHVLFPESLFVSEICYVTVTIPRMLTDLVSQKETFIVSLPVLPKHVLVLLFEFRVSPPGRDGL